MVNSGVDFTTIDHNFDFYGMILIKFTLVYIHIKRCALTNVFVRYSGLAIKFVKAALAELPSASGIVGYEELERPPEMIEAEIALVTVTLEDGPGLVFYVGAKGLGNKTMFSVSSIALSRGLCIELDDEVGTATVRTAIASQISKIAEFHVPISIDLGEITVDGLAQYLTVGDE